jgi:hypothetical protein
VPARDATPVALCNSAFFFVGPDLLFFPGFVILRHILKTVHTYTGSVSTISRSNPSIAFILGGWLDI